MLIFVYERKKEEYNAVLGKDDKTNESFKYVEQLLLGQLLLFLLRCQAGEGASQICLHLRTGMCADYSVAGPLPGEQQSPGLLHLDHSNLSQNK